MNFYKFSTYGLHCAKAKTLGLALGHHRRNPADNLVTESPLSIRC